MKVDVRIGPGERSLKHNSRDNIFLTIYFISFDEVNPKSDEKLAVNIYFLM